jgi:hypothetical protein
MSSLVTRPLGILIILGIAAFATVAASGEEQAETAVEEETKHRILWSVTTIADFNIIDSEDGPDKVGGFFDQYDFTPNKRSSVGVELGVRDASFDLIGNHDTPRLQIRYSSPTSNLGISGSEIDKPFFNQRLDVYGRRRGIFLDLHYRRMRTEELRDFPNTEGGALIFDDLTDSSDRFTRERTGFDTELRVRPLEFIDIDEQHLISKLAPEVSVRGGYEDRDGLKQRNFLRPTTADWLGIPQQMERSASDVGGGLLLAPWGLATITLDFDHERFRWDSGPILEGNFGYGPPESSRTIGYVPNTDQSTGTIRLTSKIGERVQLDGGLQLTRLEQTGDRTPNQKSAGMDDNSVTYYSANAAVDVQILGNLSLETVFKFDRRNNDIDRSTDLFNPDNGTQIDEYMRNWRRYEVGGEFVYRMRGANKVSIGARYEDIQRDLEFTPAAPGTLRILPENALVDQDTRMTTVYGQTVLNPLQGLRFTGEVGYRDAPRTGYIVDLDNYVYGNLRASYVIPLPRIVMVSAFVSGSTGRNDDFDQVSGLGPQPAGPPLDRNFDRSTIDWGITLNGSPVDDLSLFGSLFFNRDDQNHSFAVSNFQRYFQDFVAIDFANDGKIRFKNRQMSLILGANAKFGEKTDGSIRYTFTRTESRYDKGSPGSQISSIEANQRIDSDAHGIHLELRHTLRAGLRVLVGYGLQIYNDDAPVPQSVASAVTPFDRSTLQHRVTLGVTLTQELFAKAN